MSWWKKKSKEDLSSDSSMTRYIETYCNHCGKTTRHKVYRNERGSSRADYQCKSCGNSYSGSW